LKPYGILVALVALPLLTSGALASSPDQTVQAPSYDPTPTVVDTTRIGAATKLRPPPIELPDIRGRVWKLQQAERHWLAPQLKKSKQVIAFFENPAHRWIVAPRKTKCWQVAWQRQCTLARAKLRLSHALAEVAEHRLTHELPLINDWRTAVRFVQRIYPGTESWMLYTSDREGGWGPWVWYGGSHWTGHHIGNDFLGEDTAGGWMQFRYSTFAPYWRHTQDDLKSRGYELPYFGDSIYSGWLSPLAQALTAGYMRYTGQDACHWCL
jgi:hypothetical protein